MLGLGRLLNLSDHRPLPAVPTRAQYFHRECLRAITQRQRGREQFLLQRAAMQFERANDGRLNLRPIRDNLCMQCCGQFRRDGVFLQRPHRSADPPRQLRQRRRPGLREGFVAVAQILAQHIRKFPLPPGRNETKRCQSLIRVITPACFADRGWNWPMFARIWFCVDSGSRS